MESLYITCHLMLRNTADYPREPGHMITRVLSHLGLAGFDLFLKGPKSRSSIARALTRLDEARRVINDIGCDTRWFSSIKTNLI